MSAWQMHFLLLSIDITEVNFAFRMEGQVELNVKGENKGMFGF